MSNAKGSGKDNKLTQPSKVVAQSRTEANAVSSQDLRQKAQRAVAMPAAAVRAAIASATKNAIPAVRVAYDVLSRLLTFVETGHAVDLALLKTIKGALDTARAGDAITQKNIVKVLNDITLMNEVVTRVISYNRTYAEIVSSTDLPAKSLTKAPRVDTARSADSRLLLIGKNNSEVITLPENFSKIVAFNRNPSEALTSVDIKVFAVSKPRTDITSSADAKATQLSKPKSDTFNLADLSKLNLDKVINDISSASDSDKITFTKHINDFVSAIHQANVDYAFTSSEVNLAQIGDTLTRLISFVRLFTDVARPVDAMSRVVSTPRTETQIVYDTLTRVVSFNKVFTDTETTVDVLTRVVQYNRALTEIPRATDAPAKQITKAPFVDTGRAIDASRGTFSKPRTDIARAADTFTRVSQFNRNFNSTVASAQSIDIFSAVRQYNRLFFDTASSADQFVKISAFNRLPAEILTATETFAKVFFRPRSFVDASQAADVFARVVAYNRTTVDTSQAADVFSKTMFRPRNIVDNSRAADLITAKFIAKRLQDLVGASDIFVITGNIRPGTFPPADLMQLRDIFVKLVSFIRTFNDTAKAQDTDVYTLNKTAGSTYRVWGDFNELIVDFDTAQTLDTFRTELMSVAETIGKRYNKIANKQLTYYYDAYPLTDFAELTFANGVVFDQDQLFTYTDSYQADSERVLVGDIVTKISQSVRGFADVTTANEVVGRSLSRTVGDVRSRIFDDVADLFYTSEYYSTANGVDATVLFTNNYPSFGLTVVNAGEGYRAGQQFTIPVNGANCTFSVATVSSPVVAGGSIAFAAQSIRIPVSTAFTYGTGNFTIEWWSFQTGSGGVQGIWRNSTGDAVNSIGFWTITQNAGTISVNIGNGTTTDVIQSNSAIPLNTWHHYAFVRNGNLFTLYVDGVAQTQTLTSSINLPAQLAFMQIGNAGGNYTGRITNFRIVKGSSVYTSNFTPPTAPLTAISGTSLLLLAATAPTFLTDSSSNNFTITNIGATYSATTPLTAVDSNGAILTLTAPTGTPTRVVLNSSYFNDYAGLSFGSGSLDQDLAQANVLTYTYPGPDTINVGPRSAEAKRSVIGQELQYTLKDRADGDTVKYADSSSKQINKQARRYLPQGVFDDYAGLTFGTEYDMDLTQTLSKSWPESISVIDITSRVTLGPTKRNRDTVESIDLKATSLSKPKADTTDLFEVFAKRYEKSAGAWANTSWRDYNEISGFALSALLEMPIEYEGRFELILTPETIGKSIIKPLRFQSYIWRDFNELTFGTTRDEEITFSWFTDSSSDIARTMDDARRTISPRKSDVLLAQETFGKDIIIGGIGDARNPGQFRDFLGLFPIGEHGVDGMPIMDEELIFKINPGSRLDIVSSADSRVKRIDKYVVRTVQPYWSDPAELTFGTTYDQELVQYQPTTRDESFTASDLFRKVSTIIRGVNDIVRASDRMLLSKNGLTNSTYVFAPIPDAVRSQDISGRQIVKAVGDYKSQSSLWEDFVELTVSYDLAQYYYRGPDSTLDISRTMDVKANFFNKRAGRVQNILNVNTFDSDIFFDVDLLQTFAQDYVTEIIRPIDERTLRYGKNQSEIITLPEFFGKSIIKPGIGDTIVDDWAVYSPLYLNYFSDLEDSLQKQYPPRRIDVARPVDTKANYYSKQAGFDPINKWYTNFEYLSNDETNVREGIVENRENTFAQTKFTNYLDEIIYEYNEEQINTPFRVENTTAVDYFTRVLNTIRSFTEVNTASDQPSLTVSPATKVETQRAIDVKIVQYNKTAGENLYTIWTDYNEIDVYQQDLTQYYEPYRVEYLKSIDAYVARFTKVCGDVTRSPDSVTRSIGLPKNENPRSVDALGKFTNKPQVGDSTLTAWYDSYEILSYDPTLLTYGEIRTTRFDIGRANDDVGKTYTVKPGELKSRTWYDFNEFEIVNAEAFYWPPYVIEPTRTSDNITQKIIDKRLVDAPISSDSGTVRVFSSNSYIRDTSPYYADDYVNEGVVTSTF